MAYPVQRLRRLRSTPVLRNMVRETILTSNDFIYPLFVVYGKNKKIPISSMPGVFQYSVDQLYEPVQQIAEAGIPAVLLFGIPETKDSLGTSAWQEDGVVQQAIREIKKLSPELIVITDVCMCEYTDHGHCGALDQDGQVLNDATLDLLAREALSHAEAGCDMVAPSDMMDGRVGVIREMLDDGGFQNTLIMSYAAKYASSFYAPFRDAVCSAPSFGDRKTHQMNPANVEEALLEVELDLDEGADIIMVKPAMAYLDVIQRIKEEFRMPTAAYQVSGEYSMLRAGIEAQYLTNEAIYESLLSIKRAGADLIISHFAPDFLEGKLNIIC